MELDYLKTTYDCFIITREDLIRTLDLVSKLSHANSASIECNSLSFIPDWEHNTMTLAITNDLTYFRSNIELLGESSHRLQDSISIKTDLLNKLKPYYKEKILIYKKDEQFYIRLIDGDLLISAKYSNISKLAFVSSIEDLIYECDFESFGKLMQSYRNMIDDYSDKWLAFDGDKLSLCGLNFYAETEIKTPVMCILMSDVDLIVKLYKYYSNTRLQVFSTSSKVRLHIKVGNTEIEILNVISNINKVSIDKLSSYIAKPSHLIELPALSRILNIALAVSDLNKDCLLKIKDDRLLVILNSKKGDSDFNLVTQKLDAESEEESVKLNVNTLNKIISSFNDERLFVALYKIYTTVCSENIKVIILNK